MIDWHFFDESRYGQQGNIYRTWTDTNTRSRIVKQLGFKSCYLIGSVNPVTGDKTGIVFSTLDTDVMNLFFEEFSEDVPEGHHAIVVWDGAGFHRGSKLNVPDNITFRMLPPYSPELNPIERIWQWLKEHYLGNCIYNDLEELFEVGTNAWNNLTNETVKSVCKVDWLPT